MTKFYNSEIKEKFIDSQLEAYASRYITIFNRTKLTENALKKDVYEMTTDEIEEVMVDFASSSETTARDNLARLSAYIDWTIANGYRQSNTNFLTELRNSGWHKNFVYNTNTYYKKEDLVKIANGLSNYQDAFILYSLFEGVKGKAFSEILLMEKGDYYEENGRYFLKVRGEKERTIEIGLDYFSLLEKTSVQDIYYTSNGYAALSRIQTTTFVDEDDSFVFKRCSKSTGGSANRQSYLISSRTQSIKKWLDIPSVAPTNIFLSGLMHYANEMAVDGVLSYEDFLKISERFGYTNLQNKDGSKNANEFSKMKNRFKPNDDFKVMYGYELKFEK